MKHANYSPCNISYRLCSVILFSKASMIHDLISFMQYFDKHL